MIPHLQDLCFRRNSFEVPDGFAQSFVKLHAEDWRTAQAHWEKIVELVLDTDAVERSVSGNRAVHQAVRAAAILLSRTDLCHKCPICRLPSGPQGSGYATRRGSE